MKLEVQNIKKSFGDKEILKDISFSAESGKALGLLGRNGAGKTTTIRILMDVFHADSGEVLLDGSPFDPQKIQIGYLPEERGLYPKRMIIEQMVYLARLRGIDKKTALANSKRWLQRLSIDSYEKKLLETLSKGNQQKIQLAATLVCDPDIIILDEPFSGLDPVNAQVLKDVIRELIAEDKIVIFSSHQMSYVEEFCEDIVMIHRGEVVLDGNLLEIQKEYGKDRLVVGAENLSCEELKNLLTRQLSDCMSVTDKKKQEVIVKLAGGVSKKEFFQRLSAIEHLTVEHFEIYKPPLSDIFVAHTAD